MDNFDKVRKIIVEELDIPESQVTLESNLIDDLGADSLSLVEMLMNFEAEYDVTIPDDNFDNIKTVGDIVNTLNELM